MRIERDPDGRIWTIVESFDEIPKGFASEREEADWWASRDFSDELRAQMLAQPLPESLLRMFPHLQHALGRR